MLQHQVNAHSALFLYNEERLPQTSKKQSFSLSTVLKQTLCHLE